MSDAEKFTIDRRDLLKSAGGIAIGLASLGHAATPRRRWVIVGMGSRSRMYSSAITQTFREGNELVGICDTNPGRLELAASAVAAAGASPGRYLAADFGRMLAELKPDAVIVTSPDATHDEYIVRALEAGADAVTEKPLTTTPEKA